MIIITCAQKAKETADAHNGFDAHYNRILYGIQNNAIAGKYNYLTWVPTEIALQIAETIRSQGYDVELKIRNKFFKWFISDTEATIEITWYNI